MSDGWVCSFSLNLKILRWCEITYKNNYYFTCLFPIVKVLHILVLSVGQSHWTTWFPKPKKSQYPALTCLFSDLRWNNDMCPKAPPTSWGNQSASCQSWFSFSTLLYIFQNTQIFTEHIFTTSWMKTDLYKW